MKTLPIVEMIGLTLVIYLLEARHVKSVKVKVAIGGISAIALTIGILILFYPELPGPTDWVLPLYNPLNHIIGTE
ncbi:hypothetical protein [Paenibacillus oryzisoli]|uniref:Uncharacterized protein n=1 Tax=Paenibacillus oryzisoli TaxID=1850517 RepID=A0A198AKR3_9BACL|nr:hypothetical protein [Paenibacillus oryzisoli]OAS21616.1 hypothetical protein A8708_16975 [Paenibacillus oryzisoli]